MQSPMSPSVSLTSKSPRSEDSAPTHLCEGSGGDGRSRLQASVRTVAGLTSRERDQMHSLMGEHFANVTRARFEADLAEKDWAFVVTDPQADRICGFSTLTRLTAQVDGVEADALYSGDTIISRTHRTRSRFPQLMGRNMFTLADERPETPTFWLLLTSGYRTYHFLHLFFREFFPRFDANTPPWVQRLMDTLACMRFGDQYDRESGVVRFDESSPLLPGISEIGERLMKNPHVEFFVRSNPAYAAGDNLVCVTELSRANLTRAGQRMPWGGEWPR